MPAAFFARVSVDLNRQYRDFTKLVSRFNTNPAFKASSCTFIDANFKIDFEDKKNNANSSEYLVIDQSTTIHGCE